MVWVFLAAIAIIGPLLFAVGVGLLVCERRAKKTRGELGSTYYMLWGGGLFFLPCALSLAVRLLA